jgi:hypothetical protein
MPRAYLEASAGGTLPANARQIYYAARGEILERTGKTSLDSQYFCQTLLVDYVRENRVDWDLVWDDRGHFSEPHTEQTFGLGTINVRNYLALIGAPSFLNPDFSEGKVETHGPDGRFSAVLFIEKEGFMPLFERVRLAERHDIAIMSTKGMSVTAARNLIDVMCGFEAYGIHRHAIGPAIREVVALGFAEITEHGRAGNREYRRPNKYRLTYREAKGAMGNGTHEWRGIETIEQAEEVATMARRDADPTNISVVRKERREKNLKRWDRQRELKGRGVKRMSELN